MRYLHTRKYDAVIHLASKNNIKNEFDAELIESNIILTKEIFKVNTRIVYASSCVAKYPLNPYAFSKLYAEYLGQIHGNAIGLRFQNVYGPGNNKGIIWWLMQQPDGAKITIRGDQLVRDYIYIDDVVDAIVRLINPSSIYVNIDALQEMSQSFTPKQLIDMVYERNIILGDSFKILPAKGVVDVGTGTGTQTMDVVNLYMKLSGKIFDISLAPAGDNEPLEMISDNAVLHIKLEQGLTKLINN